MKNKIEIKKLKRKRLIANRVKCHGTNNSCARTHPGNPRKPKSEDMIMTYKKVSWLKGLLNKIKSWISRIFR